MRLKEHDIPGFNVQCSLDPNTVLNRNQRAEPVHVGVNREAPDFRQLSLT